MGTPWGSERGGHKWRKLRDSIMKRDKHVCQVCLRMKPPRYTTATQVDHILNKARGGTDAPSNLQAICKPCHEDKTAVESGHRIKPTIGPDGWPVE